MKLPFQKKEIPKELKAVTLQDLQQQFNQLLLEYGDLHYRLSMINSQVANIKSDINTRAQKMDQLGIDAQKLRQKMQEEVQKKVAEGIAKPLAVEKVNTDEKTS